MASVCVLGSANVDIVVDVAHLPRPGETVGGGTLRRGPGGKGLNQAVAAARLGAAVTFVGCVGTDADGTWLAGLLAAEGIDTSALERADVPTGTALIMVDAAGANLIAVAPGANAALEAPAMLPPARVLLAQLEVPLTAVREAAGRARAGGSLVVLNAAPAAAGAGELVGLADVLVVNETEAAALSGEVDPRRGAGWLAEHLGGTAVVTLGADGVVADGPAGPLAVPAVAVEVVDTVGAGDAFCGALAWALADHRALPDALAIAVAAGAVAVTRRGAAAAMPTPADLPNLPNLP